VSQNESVIGLSLTIVQAVRYGGKSDWELVRHVWNRDRRGPLAKHALRALGESQGMPTMKIPSARGLMADLTSDSSDHRKIAWIARRWHPCRGLRILKSMVDNPSARRSTLNRAMENFDKVRAKRVVGLSDLLTVPTDVRASDQVSRHYVFSELFPTLSIEAGLKILKFAFKDYSAGQGGI